jgi:hypothetical protein
MLSQSQRLCERPCPPLHFPSLLVYTGSMFRDDYLIRMITQAVQSLLKAAGLKKAGDYPQALQAIDQALEQLTGMDAGLLRRLDDEALYTALTVNENLDLQRLGILADLFREEGDIQVAMGRLPQGRESHIRSLVYHLETGFDESLPPTAKLTRQVDELVALLGLSTLPDGSLWTLFCYYERAGALLKAEQSLLELSRRPELKAGIHPELVDFYSRLMEKPSGDLAQAGFSRKEIREKLKKASQPDEITKRLPPTTPRPASERPTKRLPSSHTGGPAKNPHS